MKMERGLIFAAGLAFAASACASAGATGGASTPGAGGSAASASAVRCAAGVPANTPFATAAQNALNRTLLPSVTAETKQGLYTQAMEQARQGIAADASNPLHHFLAAQAAVGLSNYAAADSAFRRTVELCPEYAAEVTPLRENAAGLVLDAGEEAYNRQDSADALANWERVARHTDRNPGVYNCNAEVYCACSDETVT